MSADFIITITDRSRSGEFGAWLRQQGVRSGADGAGPGHRYGGSAGLSGAGSHGKGGFAVCACPAGRIFSGKRWKNFGWTFPGGAL